jgi:hypothetical protein
MALRGFKKRLVNNSVDAYVLSLETINRLSVESRLESFCMLLCNAWELLLKARIVELHGRGAIYYPKKPGENRRTLSGVACARLVFSNKQLNIRLNLEKVIELRDECTHLVIATVPSDIIELLQSCVLNYHKCLENWFEMSLANRIPVGMMTLVFDIAPMSSGITVLRQSLGAEEIKFLTKFQAEIKNEAWILGNPSEYVAHIEHKVMVVNKPGQADVQLVGGEGGTPVHIVERAKDPARTHPLYRKDAIKKIRSRIPGSYLFNEYSFDAMCDAMNARQRGEWHFKMELDGSRSQYSEALVDAMVQRINSDPSCVERARKALSDKKRALGHYRSSGRSYPQA